MSNYTMLYRERCGMMESSAGRDNKLEHFGKFGNYDRFGECCYQQDGRQIGASIKRSTWFLLFVDLHGDFYCVNYMKSLLIICWMDVSVSCNILTAIFQRFE